MEVHFYKILIQVYCVNTPKTQ